MDGQGQVASEAAIKAAAEQARIAAARTPEGVMLNFQEHLKLSPEEAAQLYNDGFTSLGAVKKGSQKKLEKALPALTPTQVKRLRMDIRLIDLEAIEGAEAKAPPAAPEAPAADTPEAPKAPEAPATAEAPDTAGAEPAVEGPFEGGCPACNSTIEVTGPGRFQCPHCSATSEMAADGTVTLLTAGGQPPAAPAGAAPPPEAAHPQGPACAHCKAVVSVQEPGLFRCPGCMSVSELGEDGTITLKQTPDVQFSALCANCQVPVQVAQPGMFRCPGCMSVSELGEDGAVTLKQGPEAEADAKAEAKPETDGPRSASCGSCGASVKVPKPGKFRCPECKSISRLAEDDSVTLVKGPDGKPPEEPSPPAETAAESPAPETPASAEPSSVGCPVCEAQVKVPKPGKFRCPSCRSISRLAEDGKVTLVKGAPKPEATKEEAAPAKDDKKTDETADKKGEEAADKAADEDADEWDLEDEEEKEPEKKDKKPPKKKPPVDPEQEYKDQVELAKAMSGGVRIGGF